MTEGQEKVERTVRAFLGRVKKGKDVNRDTKLHADGIGLDSLETAELSAVLEDELGKDPFSDGQIPETIGDIVAFYDSPTPGS